MILINPIGGLASQLHKYFTALALAKRLNTEVKFYLDPDRSIKDRGLELDKFSIDIVYASKFEIFYFTKIQKRLNRLKRKWRVSNQIYRFKNLMTYEYFKEIKNNTFVNDEWIMGDIYFRHLNDEIQEKFVLKNDMSDEAKVYKTLIIQNDKSISIHFRRGDYLKPNCSEFHGNLTLEYYQKALQLVVDKIGGGVLFIFSDDIEWVKENFVTGLESYYISLSTHEDIVLMSLCKHNIIANSGYSWLGSYFNDNENKIIIAPKQWVADKEISDKIFEYTDTSKWIQI
jgi:hypothetical protein